MEWCSPPSLPTFNHTMDFLKDQMNKASGNSQQTNNNNNTGNEQQESGGFMGKINSAMGGGHSGEKKEGQSSPFFLPSPSPSRTHSISVTDMLDKGSFHSPLFLVPRYN